MPQDNLQNSGNRKEPDGTYQPLYPSAAPKALTHEQMDYNLDLIGQIIKGYRVMGSGSAGSLDLVNDTNKVLKLYRVQSGDTELLAAGAVIEDYVWIPAAAAVDGSQGYQGGQGSQGFSGSQGFQGDGGDQGFQGFQGLKGNNGDQGLKGDQGAQLALIDSNGIDIENPILGGNTDVVDLDNEGKVILSASKFNLGNGITIDSDSDGSIKFNFPS